MAQPSEDAGRLITAIKEIQKRDAGCMEAFDRYLEQERFIMRSGMSDQEEENSRSAFARAYERELDMFHDQAEAAAQRLGIMDEQTFKEAYETLGISEVMEARERSKKTPETDPLQDLRREQADGIHDFHKWMQRNCDKSGFAYLGSAGSVREYADAFMKKPGKDQLRALYIVENRLGEEPDAAAKADAALDQYVPDLKAIKKQMMQSKFHIFSRMDGQKFRWNLLSDALMQVEEAKEEKEQKQQPVNEPRSASEAQIHDLSQKYDLPEEHVRNTVSSIGTMYRDLARLDEIIKSKPGSDASQEDLESYENRRNDQIAQAGKSSEAVIRAVETSGLKEKIGEFKDNLVEGTDAVLNINYAYSVAAGMHTAAKGFRMHAASDDDLESVYSSMFQACGGNAESRFLKISESAMDIGLGVLTVISSGAAAISDMQEMLANRNVVRKMETAKTGAQFTQNTAWTVGGIADTADSIGSITGMADPISKMLSTTSSITGIAAGGADLVMGSLDTTMGNRQRLRAVKAKEYAGKLTDKVKKAELRGAAKAVRRKNKWKIRQGLISLAKGALGVAAGALALTAGLPAVAAAVSAAGTAFLVGQFFLAGNKERIGNNRKAIDSHILAKNRELSEDKREDGKKTRAIEDLVEERKKRLKERKEKYAAGSRQWKYLDSIEKDEKCLKHAIRTEAAVKMGCLTQDDCRQKLDMQTVEKAFRHVYLKDPDGAFSDDNIITKKDAERYFVSPKSDIKDIEKLGNVKELDDDGKQKLTKEEAVERLTYRDLLKSYGMKVQHHSAADGKKMESNMEKARRSMEK